MIDRYTYLEKVCGMAKFTQKLIKIVRIELQVLAYFLSLYYAEKVIKVSRRMAVSFLLLLI